MLDLPVLPAGHRRQRLRVLVPLIVGVWPKEVIFAMHIGFYVSRVTLSGARFGQDLSKTLLRKTQNRTEVGTVRV